MQLKKTLIQDPTFRHSCLVSSLEVIESFHVTPFKLSLMSIYSHWSGDRQSSSGFKGVWAEFCLASKQRYWWYRRLVIISELFHPIVPLVWQACSDKAEFFFFTKEDSVRSLCKGWNKQSRSIAPSVHNPRFGKICPSVWKTKQLNRYSQVWPKFGLSGRILYHRFTFSRWPRAIETQLQFRISYDAEQW